MIGKRVQTRTDAADIGWARCLEWVIRIRDQRETNSLRRGNRNSSERACQRLQCAVYYSLSCLVSVMTSSEYTTILHHAKRLTQAPTEFK